MKTDRTKFCAAGQNSVHSVRDMAEYSAWCREVLRVEDAVYQGDEILGVNGKNWDTVELLMSETREAERLSWMSSTSFCSLRRASSTCSRKQLLPLGWRLPDFSYQGSALSDRALPKSACRLKGVLPAVQAMYPTWYRVNQ